MPHCPTGQMWSDVLNNPKWGKAFRFFCIYLMNVSDYDGDDEGAIKTHPLMLYSNAEGEQPPVNYLTK